MRYTLLLLLCGLLFSSFFWVNEEKELAHLLETAHTAMQQHNYRAAQEAYRLLLKKAMPQLDASLLSWQQRIEYSMQLARACEQLGELEEGVRVLSALLEEHPPSELTPRLLLMQARLLAPQSSPEKGYLLLRHIAESLPMEQWSKEDLSLFHALSYALDEYFDAQLKRAKRYYVTGFYEEAIALYEEVLTAIQHASFPKAQLNRELLEKKVRYALAECHFSIANYEKSLALVEDQATNQGRMGREVLYLMALCYKQKQEYERALEYLQEYAHSACKEELVHYDHALFELGFFYYTHSQPEKARHYFELLQQLPHHHGRPKLIGGIYLARLELQEGHAEKAQQLLHTLVRHLPQGDPIQYELFFLQGEAAYLQHHVVHAQEAYERSLPGTHGRPWGMRARMQLSACYLKRAQEPALTLSQQEEYFDRAQKTLSSLLHSEDPLPAVLALARLSLLRAEPLTRIDALLHSYQEQFSLAQQHEALLLRAQADTEHLKPLLVEATDARFAALPTYIDAWYARGLEAFHRGMNTQQPEAFGEAVRAFECALTLCQPHEHPLTAKILKLEAKACLYQNSALASLEILERLLIQFMEDAEEREETLYLRGLVAAKLAQEIYFPIAEESLKQVASLYPQGLHAKEALYLLGTLYFQHSDYTAAHQTFLQLAQGYPDFPQAAEGWFWAAKSLALLNSEDPQLFTYRQTLYSQYPTHERAAEAYFCLYPYNAYLAGEPEAIVHLAQFATRFPHSSLRLPAYYLLGLQLPTPQEAIQAFTQAIHLFPQLTVEGEIPDITTLHFYYQSMHQLALLYLQTDAQWERGVALLQQILADFIEPQHPFTLLFKQQEAVPELYAQSVYSLAKAYLDRRQRAKAEKQLLELLTAFKESAVEENLYLALCWREQGLLAMGDEEYATALNCFDIAETAGRLALSDEQRLMLWLSKSDCCRHQHDDEQAMRLLSKVINADVASPLRMRAMFLRAEIYEQQGRPELAARQLEAIVKKGGDWATQARGELDRLLPQLHEEGAI